MFSDKKSIIILVLVLCIAFLGWSLIKKETPRKESNGSFKPSGASKEVVVDDAIKYKFIGAKDLGSTLKGSESEFPEQTEDLATEGKFVKVTVEVKNIGEESTTFWGLRDLIDKKGREFRELISLKFDPWIPEKEECHFEIKPGFSAQKCSKIYEVATNSTPVKLKVYAGDEQKTLGIE